MSAFADVAKRVDEILVAPLPQDAPRPNGTDPTERLRKIGAALKPVGDDAVSTYLASRHLKAQESLRLHPGLEYWDTDGDNPVMRGEYPAMVAKISGVDDKLRGLHVTYLGDGGKADVTTAKKTLKGSKPLTGCAIRLFPQAERIAVAEGIETALAVHELTGWPVWATISAGGMEALQIPEGIRQVLICGDNDKNFVGQCAAYNLAKRLYAQGVSARVRIAEGGDFADDLMRKKATEDMK